MKVYLIETGQCCQCGTILRAYTKLSDCLAEYEHLQDVEKRKTWITVTYGLNEYDKTPGCIFGFLVRAKRREHNCKRLEGTGT